MFRRSKFKTYKSDAAPFFFFIDIFPLNMDNFTSPNFSALANYIKNNPIMPLPMRVDCVFNGESSIIIRPNSPISVPLNESLNAVINPIPLLQLGIENLLYFAEIRSQEFLFRSLKLKKAHKWWESTRFLYGNLQQLEEDFSAFLKAYLYTIVKTKINEDDITAAAIEYCNIVNNICKDKMLGNKILVDTKKNQKISKLYKEKVGKYREDLRLVKKTEYHPELVDIEVYNFEDKSFPFNRDSIKSIRENYDNTVLKYIPLLFYDDLHECMLQNLRLLESNEMELLEPSILLDKNVISILNSQEKDLIDLDKYKWLTDLSGVDIDLILNSIVHSPKSNIK